MIRRLFCYLVRGLVLFVTVLVTGIFLLVCIYGPDDPCEGHGQTKEEAVLYWAIVTFIWVLVGTGLWMLTKRILDNLPNLQIWNRIKNWYVGHFTETNGTNH